MRSVAGLRRYGALFALGIRRVGGRVGGVDRRRVLLGITGVALAVMLMTTVTGVAVGLASQSAIQGESVDYWIVPEGGTGSSIAVPVDGPRLGATHRVSSRLATDSRIDYVTPVLVQIVSVRHPSADTSGYVVFVGVIPSQSSRTVAGLPTTGLTPGDPYFANGSYDGRWTGDAVFSTAAAELLNASERASITVPGSGQSRSFTVTTIAKGDVTTGAGTVPVALVHLAELQAVAGGTNGDVADQILVSTDHPGVRPTLERVYPQATVVTKTGFTTRNISTSSLPLAMGVTAFLVSLVVGLLFVGTMMGLEITADRANLAVLAAIGYSRRSQSILVLAETLTLTAIGGVLGTALGAGTIVLANAVATRYLGVDSIALLTPWLLAYGLGAALLIGVLAAPYPILLARRTDTLQVIDR